MPKRSKIPLVIFLVGLALVALISVQVYWMNYTYELSEKEFSANVKEALEKTVQEINTAQVCYEVFTKFHVNPQEGFYILKNKWKNRRYNDVELGHQDTVPMYYNDTRFNMPFRWGNIMFTRHVNVTALFQFRYTSDGKDTGHVYSNSFEKATLTNYQETLSEGKSIETYYKPALMDSLLRKNLAFYSIYEPFVFAFIDSQKNKVDYVSVKNKRPDVLSGSFRSRLTPTEYFSRLYDVSVSFDNYRGHIFSTFRNMLFLSILIIFILTVSFFFFVMISLRQRRLSELKTDFINNMTHEFKTPLTNISLAVETIAEQNLLKNEKGEKMIQIVSFESERLRENIERILQIARYEKEKLHLSREKIDLHQLIEKVITVFEPLLQEQKVTFHRDLHAKKSVLELDETHFFNMLYNVIDNAAKYNGSSPEITIATEDRPKGVIIRIKDNGIGIGSKDLKNIFEKFFRVQQGNLHDVKGYGLGLSYVKLVVESHNGSIKATSALGKGTEFEIFIPFTA